jgi:two-component system response regulator EvgA
MSSVLIVDDHAGFRRTARTLLELAGFEVVGEADDGRSALEQVSSLRPDIVLLDVQLPDMDGFEVAKRIESGGYCPRIVLTSSREASEFGGLVTSSSAHGFIPKDELSGRRLAALVE